MADKPVFDHEPIQWICPKCLQGKKENEFEYWNDICSDCANENMRRARKVVMPILAVYLLYILWLWWNS